ncbi:MAG: LppX_LprAFG lipoprotein [Chloroflexota bacterium]
MQRRNSRAGLPAVLVVALLVAACRGNSGPTLTDPGEILTKSIAAMQNAKSVHLEATVDGTFKADLTGTGTTSELNLAGTNLKGDLDLAAKNAHVTAAVPAFLGLTADIIIVGTDTFTKVSLSGEKYQKSTTSTTDPTDPTVALKEVETFLKRPEVQPVKKDDTDCGSKKCYQIELKLSADELKALMPNQDLQGASIVATILIDKNTLYPASATVTISSTAFGELKATITMSDWDKSVTITAPPAEQVE